MRGVGSEDLTRVDMRVPDEIQDGVSVIIAAYNAAGRVERAFEHLAAQEMPEGVPWEVVFVDNNSDDGTSEVAVMEWERLGAPAPLVLVHEPMQGVSKARVAGIRKARYEYLVFCDDDNWLDTGYLRGIRHVLMSEPDIGVVGGVTLPASDSELPEWFDEVAVFYTCAPRAESSCDLSDTNWLAGAGMGVRRSTMLRFFACDFPQWAPGRTGELLLASEDVEVCLWHRLTGQRLWFESSVTLRHHMEERRLNRAYFERLREGVERSREFTMPAVRVLWGLGYREEGLVRRAYHALRLLAKIVLGRNLQPEAVCFLPLTGFLLTPETRSILEAVARFKGTSDSGSSGGVKHI